MTEHEAHNIVLAWRWLLSTWAKEHPVAAELTLGVILYAAACAVLMWLSAAIAAPTVPFP